MSNYIKFLYQAGLLSTITLMGANCGGSGNNTASSKNLTLQHSNHTSKESNKNPLPQHSSHTSKESNKNPLRQHFSATQELIMSLIKDRLEWDLNERLDLSNQRDRQFKDDFLKTFEKSYYQLIRPTSEYDPLEGKKIEDECCEALAKSVIELMDEQGYKNYDECWETLAKSVIESMNEQGYKDYKEYYTKQQFNNLRAGKDVSNNTDSSLNAMEIDYDYYGTRFMTAIEKIYEDITIELIISMKEKLKSEVSSELNSLKQLDSSFKNSFLKALDEQFCQLANESFKKQLYNILMHHSILNPVKCKKMNQKSWDEFEKALSKSVAESMNSQGYEKYKKYYTDKKFNIYSLIKQSDYP
ncbi:MULTISPECIES: hypothetical protein [Candidatus Cardinium]|uniref:hypothetical protein n=1 Tax=Candidatus Cardinium TaxID=273135 RepID=UPI001FAB31E4|nr:MULTISPECIES: hypothetical protein [Cardinium]